MILMLLNLAIQGYAVVDRLEVDLHLGMTSITGETGAGKSIMLDALGLCVGDRADPKAVRPGAARTDIAASFDVSQNTRARVWLAERDLDASWRVHLAPHHIRRGALASLHQWLPCDTR